MANKRISRLIQIITGQRGSDGEDMLSLVTSFSRLEKFVHFWVLVGRSFIGNRCPIRASALSYSTLLALIPMLAVALSVTSSLLKSEGEDRIYLFIDQLVATVIPPSVVTTNAPQSAADEEERYYMENLPQTKTDATSAVDTNAVLEAAGIASTNAPVSGVRDKRVIAAQKDAAKYIHSFIQNTRSGTIGATGVVALISVAIFMLSRIEETFNDIWGVTVGRNWFVRIVQYWAVLTLGPLLLTGALALSGGPHFQATKDMVGETMVGSFLFQLLPLVVLIVTFALFYKVVPNTKVNFSAALVGGSLAGTLWFLNNVFAFLYVNRMVTNSKIYGSLALVPVFMAGLYLSWLILLFGAQVAYAFQNRASYLQEKLAENVNQRGREFIALRLMTCIGQKFQRGFPPPTITQISTELGVPSRLAQQVLQTLLAARLVVEVSKDGLAYAPARPLDTINAHHVLMAMRATVGQELVTRDEPVRAEVFGEFARIQDAEKEIASGVTMLALVDRAEAKLQFVGAGAKEETGKVSHALVPPSEAETIVIKKPAAKSGHSPGK